MYMCLRRCLCCMFIFNSRILHTLCSIVSHSRQPRPGGSRRAPPPAGHEGMTVRTRIRPVTVFPVYFHYFRDFYFTDRKIESGVHFFFFWNFFFLQKMIGDCRHAPTTAQLAIIFDLR